LIALAQPDAELLATIAFRCWETSSREIRAEVEQLAAWATTVRVAVLLECQVRQGIIVIDSAPQSVFEDLPNGRGPLKMHLTTLGIAKGREIAELTGDTELLEKSTELMNAMTRGEFR
jgi:hypothetical protein